MLWAFEDFDWGAGGLPPCSIFFWPFLGFFAQRMTVSTTDLGIEYSELRG